MARKNLLANLGLEIWVMAQLEINLGAKIVDKELAFEIVETFLNTEFSNDERHIRRINMMEE